jgi:hypothetical protein
MSESKASEKYDVLFSVSIILWHIDSLLGNDRGIYKYTTAVTE